MKTREKTTKRRVIGTRLNDDRKFTVEKCKRILNRNGNDFNDEQVRKIRDFLYLMAEIECEIFKTDKTHEQKSNSLHPGIN